MAAREQWYHPYLKKPGKRVDFMQKAAARKGTKVPTLGSGSLEIQWSQNEAMKERRIVKMKVGAEEVLVDVATLNLILDTV